MLRQKHSKNISQICGEMYVYNDIKSDWVKLYQSEIGDIKYSALSGDHNGWLKCDGRAVSRETYADLFAAIGTSFGVGDGATTFNLPDCRGRVLGAIGTGTGLSARTLGQSVGAETHTLTIDEMPAHSHTVGAIPDGTQNIAAAEGGSTTAADEVRTTITSSFTGGGGSHNNMQPTSFIGNVFILGSYKVVNI